MIREKDNLNGKKLPILDKVIITFGERKFKLLTDSEIIALFFMNYSDLNDASKKFNQF